MTRCATCGSETLDMVHQFYEGCPDRPLRTWVIVAPLYFRANADNTGVVEGYCSATCVSNSLSMRRR